MDLELSSVPARHSDSELHDGDMDGMHHGDGDLGMGDGGSITSDEGHIHVHDNGGSGRGDVTAAAFPPFHDHVAYGDEELEEEAAAAEGGLQEAGAYHDEPVYHDYPSDDEEDEELGEEAGSATDGEDTA